MNQGDPQHRTISLPCQVIARLWFGLCARFMLFLVVSKDSRYLKVLSILGTDGFISLLKCQGAKHKRNLLRKLRLSMGSFTTTAKFYTLTLLPKLSWSVLSMENSKLLPVIIFKVLVVVNVLTIRSISVWLKFVLTIFDVWANAPITERLEITNANKIILILFIFSSIFAWNC